MKAINAAMTTLAVLSVLVPALLISLFLFPRSLPWWMDGGDWLKRVNAILGNTYPMWNQTTLQYPPIFFVLVAALSGLTGEILSLKVWAVVAYCLVPLTSYFFVKELFHDRVAAVAGAWMVGFTPVWFEMLGWGGYPDLLGLAFLPLAFLGLLRYFRERSPRNLALLVVGSVLIPLTHHLTFLTFVGVLVVWGVLSALFDRGPLKPIAISLLVTGVTFGVYRLAAGPWEFLLTNEAALLSLRASVPILLYMFKDVALLTILYVVAVASVGLLILESKYRTEVLLLISWTLVPILGTQGYLLGVALDYNRILFFFAQPLMMLVAAPLIFRSDISKFLRSGSLRKELSEMKGFFKTRGTQGSNAAKQLLALGVLLLSLVAAFSTPIVGASTMVKINGYYNATDLYGDQEKLQVANFLSSHTPSTAVVVAETTMGRWIEGYAQRRVLLEEDPSDLFLTGELEREYAARAVLFSNSGMRNGYAWVLDQAPFGPFSPIISFYIGGEYVNMAELNETGSSVSWTDVTGGSHTVALVNATSISSFWVARNSSMAEIGARYLLGPVEVLREVSLSSTSGNVSFAFRASSSDPAVSLTRLTISLQPWQGLGLSRASLQSNRSLVLSTDVGNLSIASSSARAFPFDFSPSIQSGIISGWIALWSGRSGNASGLVAYDRSGILSQDGVTDVVIPKQYLIPVGQTVVTTLRAPSLYENLMKDPEFKVAYYNDRAIVLQVQS